MGTKLNEPVLQDNFPVFWDYLYVADGVVVRSDIKGTINDLKRNLSCCEIRRCDIIGRQKLQRKDENDLKTENTRNKKNTICKE